MKIGILGPVTTSKYFGGVAIFDEEIANGFEQNNCQVVLLTDQKEEKINKDIVAMGLKNTKLNRKTNDERTAITDVENITTAYDLSRIWKHLANGTFLSKDNGQMLIDILRRQQIKNKLALYIPDDLKIEISSKTGDKKGVENDTAYLELPKGKFTFTVLSQDIPNSVYGTVSLAKCGKMMWDEVMNNWN